MTSPTTRTALQAQNNATVATNGVGGITGATLNSLESNIIASIGALADSNTWTQLNNFTGGLQINGAAVRTPAAGNLTFYVNNSTGSDSNNGLTPSTAFQHLQYALNYFADNWDLRGLYTVLFQLADGTYTENINFPRYVGGQPGSHSCAIVQGNVANKTNVIFSPVAGDTFASIGTESEWGISCLKITSAGTCVRTDYKGMITHNGVTFGACNFAIQATGPDSFVEGTPQGGANYGCTLAGNVSAFEAVTNGGLIAWNGVTLTLSGTPAFSTAFALINPGGIIDNSGLTVSGSATGLKFQWYAGGAFATSAGPNGDPNSVTPGNVNGNAPTFDVLAGATYTNILTQMGNALNVFNRAVDGTNADVVLTAAAAPWILNTAVLSGGNKNWTLPAANSLPAGTPLTISDGGGISGSNTITIKRAGADSFFGVGVSANAFVLSAQFSSATVRTDGTSSWFLVGKT